MNNQSTTKDHLDSTKDNNIDNSPKNDVNKGLIPSKDLAARLIMAHDDPLPRRSNPTISSRSPSEDSNGRSDDDAISQQMALRRSSANSVREEIRRSIAYIAEGLPKALNRDVDTNIKEEPTRSQQVESTTIANNTKEEDEELKDSVHKIAERTNKLKADILEKKEEEITISQMTILNPEGSKAFGSQITNPNIIVGSQISQKSNSSFLAGFTKVDAKEGLRTLKPIKLQFADDLVNDDNSRDNSSKKKLKEEIRERRLEATTNSKKFLKQYGTKENDEDLSITLDQKEILKLFKHSFKRHKGNRALILDHELSSLKPIPMKYKEVELPSETIVEDLDICSHLGEKVTKNDEGYIWKQVDIQAMKEEKKMIAAMKKEMKAHINTRLSISLGGEEQEIGDKNIYNRKPIAILNDGKVQLIYHGNSGALNVYVLDIMKDGEFEKRLEEERMV